MTDQPEPAAVVVNGNAVVEASSLIAAVATLVSSSTATIMARLDALERGEMKRWQLHDEELARNRTAITTKFEKIENELAAEIIRVEEALAVHMVIANQHFQREHDNDIRMDARVRPVRTGAAWLVGNWQKVLLLLFGVLGFFALLGDLAARYLGGS